MLDTFSVLKMELQTFFLVLMLHFLQTPRHSIQSSLNYGSEFITFNATFREIFPNSAFKCPEQYFIWSVDIRFVPTANVTRSFKWDLSASYSINDTTLKWKRPGPCDTIQHCLGYQACLFKFGNELCKKDPMPTYRKVMEVNYTCAIDERYSEKFVPFLLRHGASSKQRNRQVLFMNARTLADDDLIRENYAKANVMFHVINEEDVFMVECPPAAEARNLGYYGNCSLDPPQSKAVAEDIWTILGRIGGAQCRKELLDTYCAYKYNKQGDCIPPVFVEKKTSSNPPFSFASLPKNGFRPDVTNYVKIHRDPHMSLIPARIGFFLLVHTSPGAFFQLFEQIYRPHHYYVIHVDRRAVEVRQVISNYLKEFGPASNIRVIPLERSFATSWGSFQVLRAELECYEELLRMGIWDFVVNLSGLDLAVRDVDDLAAALAPHRGHSIISPLNDRHPDDNTQAFAWYSCGAHVYNVTDRQIKLSEISGASQFKIISRDFANFLVSQDRGDAVNNITHLLQTSIIPDESYIATVLRLSPFKTTQLFTGTTFLKPFQGENANKLCRHSDDVDLCGRGPGVFISHDFPQLQYQTNHFYFARKFSAHPEDRTRLEVLSWAAEGYYMEVRKILPRNMLGQMSEMVINELAEEKGLDYLIEGIKFRMFRKLVPSDPCCEVPHSKSINAADEYGYWLDLQVVSAKDKSVRRVLRASFDMVKSAKCFPGGHLRMLNINTRPDPGQGSRWKRPEQLLHTFPVPVQPAGGFMLWVNMFFDFTSPLKSCTGTEVMQNPNNRVYYSFPPGSLKRTFSPKDGKMYLQGAVDDESPPSHRIRHLLITVIDPYGQVHCTKDDVVDLKHLKIPEQENTTTHTVPLVCDQFYEGLWTVRVRELNQDRVFIYKVLVYLHDEDSRREIPIDTVKRFWTIKDMMFLPETDYYDDDSLTSDQKNPGRMRSRENEVNNKGKMPKSDDAEFRENSGKGKEKHLENEEITPEGKGRSPGGPLAWDADNIKTIMRKFSMPISGNCAGHFDDIAEGVNDLQSVIFTGLQNEEVRLFVFDKIGEVLGKVGGRFKGFGNTVFGFFGNPSENNPADGDLRGVIENILQNEIVQNFLTDNENFLKIYLMKIFDDEEEVEKVITLFKSGKSVDFIHDLLKNNRERIESALKGFLGEDQTLIKMLLRGILNSEDPGKLIMKIVKNKQIYGPLTKFLMNRNLDSLLQEFEKLKEKLVGGVMFGSVDSDEDLKVLVDIVKELMEPKPKKKKQRRGKQRAVTKKKDKGERSRNKTTQSSREMRNSSKTEGEQTQKRTYATVANTGTGTNENDRLQHSSDVKGNDQRPQTSSWSWTEQLPREVVGSILVTDDKSADLSLLSDDVKSILLKYFKMYVKSCTMGDCVQVCWLCMKSKPEFVRIKIFISVICGACVLISIMSIWLFRRNNSNLSHPGIVWLLSCTTLLSSSAVFVILQLLFSSRSEREEL